MFVAAITENDRGILSSLIRQLLLSLTRALRALDARGRSTTQHCIGGTAMRCAKLTDDGLWRAIAKNTDEISALLRQQAELDEANCTAAMYSQVGFNANIGSMLLSFSAVP